MSHTPGPWFVADRAFSNPGSVCCLGSIEERHEDGRRKELWVTYMSEDFPTDEEMWANAHLIAAAPDLLEALETLLECCDVTNPLACVRERQTAEAAIAKARGEA